jgi:hypothetical protein
MPPSPTHIHSSCTFVTTSVFRSCLPMVINHHHRLSLSLSLSLSLPLSLTHSLSLSLHRVMQDSCVDLIARSVANSTGDLRHALKACKLALDLLAGSADSAGRTLGDKDWVGVREVAGALTKLAGGSWGLPGFSRWVLGDWCLSGSAGGWGGAHFSLFWKLRSM